MSRNRSGGSGCGWGFAILAALLALGSLCVSGAVGVGSVTDGVIGLPAEVHELAGLLFVLALVALGMARREER